MGLDRYGAKAQSVRGRGICAPRPSAGISGRRNDGEESKEVEVAPQGIGCGQDEARGGR